jgi:hypothetical protein
MTTKDVKALRAGSIALWHSIIASPETWLLQKENLYMRTTTSKRKNARRNLQKIISSPKTVVVRYNLRSTNHEEEKH